MSQVYFVFVLYLYLYLLVLMLVLVLRAYLSAACVCAAAAVLRVPAFLTRACRRAALRCAALGVGVGARRVTAAHTLTRARARPLGDGALCGPDVARRGADRSVRPRPHPRARLSARLEGVCGCGLVGLVVVMVPAVVARGAGGGGSLQA